MEGTRTCVGKKRKGNILPVLTVKVNGGVKGQLRSL